MLDSLFLQSDGYVLYSPSPSHQLAGFFETDIRLFTSTLKAACIRQNGPNQRHRDA